MDDFADLIVQGIPADAAFSDEDRRQARGLITACRQIATRAVTPANLGSDISRLRNGFGPWLDIVRAAIERADMPALDRAALLGAFEMAGVVLLDAMMTRQLRERR